MRKEAILARERGYQNRQRRQAQRKATGFKALHAKRALRHGDEADVLDDLSSMGGEASAKLARLASKRLGRR